MKNWFWIVLFLLIAYEGKSQKAAKDSLNNKKNTIIVSDTTISAVNDSLKVIIGKDGRKNLSQCRKKLPDWL
ncbi:hypothetical protein [Dyadobacter sp. NIV53]|uniref:hypothetical protein n=1 Tax=Dyadobacter sp. NIV53 TaxID=2861765 RepID=UPI001C87E041|nr:hypothetical protein [Dyadobacter sp. NIV53]